MTTTASSGAVEYWFDLTVTKNANGSEHRILDTYAFGWHLDHRESDTLTWAQLITAVAPLIQTDVDTFGLPA